MNELGCCLFLTACAAFAQTFSLSTSPVSIPAGNQPFSLIINLGNSSPIGPAMVAQPTWVVRWNGSPRPTALSTSFGANQVTASISGADIAQPGFNEITVMDQATGVVFPAVSWFLVSVNVAANDMAYDPVRNRFYVSVPIGQATAGAPAESILAIDASSGAVLAAISAESKPTLLAISDDSSYLYVYNGGTASISRIALAGFTSDIQIPLASGVTLNWLVVVPGSARSIATIQTTSAGSPSMIAYDDAKTRATTVSTVAITRFVFTDAQTIVAGSPSQGSYLTVWKLSSTAVTFSMKVSSSAAPDYPVTTAEALVLGFSGNLYDTLGRVPTQEADYGGVGTFVPGQHRWIVGGGNGSTGDLIIGAFDEPALTPLGRFTITRTVRRIFKSYAADPYVGCRRSGVYFQQSALLGTYGAGGACASASAPSTVNAATLQAGAISPGEILTVFGTNLGIATGRTLEFSSVRQISTDLAETQVWFDGSSGTMLYASSGLINVVAPF